MYTLLSSFSSRCLSFQDISKIINTITIAISLPPVNIQNVGTTVDASPEKRRKMGSTSDGFLFSEAHGVSGTGSTCGLNDSQSDLSDSQRSHLVRSPDSAVRLLAESSSIKTPSQSRISSPHRMSGDELREREQKIILETSAQAAKCPTISGSKATLNDIRYRGKMGLDESFSKKDKKARNQNLPAGVNDRDLELFSKSQEVVK